ncbi:MAG TPA: PEP-CTERM sorting domain-containing protein [Nitrosospira sp.]|nr:PEP-CTERM sorting domain-containing protein [Nitrosospira sp.]
MNKFFRTTIVSGILGAAILPVQAAPIYVGADFSGTIVTTGGLANSLGLQGTNTCNSCAAGTVSGHVLFDKSLIPGSGTGTVNIALTPVSGVSNNTIFDIVFGSQPLGFAFGDSNVLSGPSIQFQNGVFNGFSFVEDFVVNDKTYELNMQGSSWTLNWLKSNSTMDLVASGSLTVGNQGLTHQAYVDPVSSQLPVNPESPVNTVPEPTSIALIVLGIWGIVMTRRREAHLQAERTIAHKNASQSDNSQVRDPGEAVRNATPASV